MLIAWRKKFNRFYSNESISKGNCRKSQSKTQLLDLVIVDGVVR